MERARTVDEYIETHPDWSEALVKLRNILRSTDLEETIKWGAPCYTLDGKNVVGLGAFSRYVGLWFHQGVFLTDPDHVLINAQEGTTKGLRQWRFGSAREIKVTRVRAYVREAIENQKRGKVIKPDRARPVVLPDELQAALRKKPGSRKAFDELTRGKQREYADYIAAAKRPQTRQSRLDKILPMISARVGLNDRDRSC